MKGCFGATPKPARETRALPNHRRLKTRNSRVASRVPELLTLVISLNRSAYANHGGVGRGCGVGRGLGVALGVGLGVGVGVPLGVGVGVTVGLGVTLGVTVGLGDGVAHGGIS